MATNTNPFYTYSATAGSSKTLQKPQDGGDNNQWGNYINTDLDEIVAAVNALSDKIADANEKTLVDFTATTDAVNHVGITNAATGNGPTISTAGTDSHIDLNLTPKGTGEVNISKVDIDSGTIDGLTSLTQTNIAADATDVELKNSGSTKLATTSTGITVTGTALVDALTTSGEGTAGSPIIRLNDTNTGIFDNGSNSLAISCNGSLVLDVIQTGMNLTGTATVDTLITGVGSESSPAIGVGDADTGIFDAGSNAIGFTNGGSEKMRIDANGNVGLGTESPSRQFTVENTIANSGGTIGLTSSDSSTSGTCGIIHFGNSTDSSLASINGIADGATDAGALLFKTEGTGGSIEERMRIDSSGNLLFDLQSAPSPAASSPGQVFHYNNYLATCRAGGVALYIGRNTNDGTLVGFRREGSDKGTISVSGGTVSYNAFTGSHYGWINGSCEKGKVVIMTGNNQHAYDDINEEIIYGIEECSIENDSRFLGCYVSLLNPSDEKTIGDSENSPNPDLIMSVGNGVMWVVDEGSDITQGDNLITSTTQGHARKDPQTATYSHIIGRAGEPVDWSEVTETIGGKKHKLISVLFDICSVKN